MNLLCGLLSLSLALGNLLFSSDTCVFSCYFRLLLLLASSHSSSSQDGKKQQIQWILVGLISGLALIVTFVGAIIAYKYWQRRKKQQEQARFLRLFEDNDDIEDELGIGPLSHVI